MFKQILYTLKSQIILEPRGPIGRHWSPFPVAVSRTPAEAARPCPSGLVDRVVCPFTPQLSLVLINRPRRDGTHWWPCGNADSNFTNIISVYTCIYTQILYIYVPCCICWTVASVSVPDGATTLASSWPWTPLKSTVNWVGLFTCIYQSRQHTRVWLLSALNTYQSSSQTVADQTLQLQLS